MQSNSSKDEPSAVSASAGGSVDSPAGPGSSPSPHRSMSPGGPGGPQSTPSQPMPPRSGTHYPNYFFCFLFVKKLSVCLEGKSMTPCWGNTVLFRSYQQLPCPCLGPLKGAVSAQKALFQAPSQKGLFELTQRPSRALYSPCALLSELQRDKDTVRCAALGADRGHRAP